MSDNIMTITKETAPYLYLTDDSGIYTNVDSLSRITIPINPDASGDFQLAALQFWLRPKHVIDDSLITVFGPGINIVATADGDRSIVSCPSDTSVIYMNGEETATPYITPNEWTAITVAFDPPIDMFSYSGLMTLWPGVVFNNIAIFSNESAGLGQLTPEANIYNALVGTSTIVVEDMATVAVFANGLDVFTDVRWETVEKPII